MAEPNLLLAVKGLKKYFLMQKSVHKAKKVFLKAIDGVDLDVYEGDTVGLVGESGCGKSTLGRCILRLHSVTDGSVLYRNHSIVDCNKKEMREYRKQMQMIFQDPYASLNPRMTVYKSVKAPLDVFKIGNESEKSERVEGILEYVGLGKDHINKYPHEMSGGQRQRVAIARAMILDPDFIVCDEPVSALDVSVRSQVLNLMRKIQKEQNLSYLFISHDLSVVRYLCNKVVVMYFGKFVEIASKQELFNNPTHPYTKALLSAIPIPDVNVRSRRVILKGDVPNPMKPPSGCNFHSRCIHATSECSEVEPPLVEISPDHKVACLNIDKISGGI